MDRLINGFNELYQNLTEDCQSFDNNKVRKATDIAGRIRTLVKDGKPQTRSILQQLDRKNIPFKDSAIPYTANPGFSFFDIYGSITNSVIIVSGVYMGLVYKIFRRDEGESNFSFAPLFKREQLVPEIREIPFSAWWEQIIYEDPNSKFILSRKDLILSSAEQDGFAHLDPKLNLNYASFLEPDSLFLEINGQKINFTNNPAKNSIRQIGHEIILTLKDHLSDLISD